MALTPLTHRRLATVTSAGLTINQVLDAVWTGVAPTVTTYSDGSTRLFSGTGATGWTWTLVQVSGVTEAVYATPPGGTLNQRFILAGRSAAPTPSPTMLAPETFLASGLHLGLALNAGAFTTWNAAAPFTSGYFSGYTRLGQAVNTMSTSITMTIYESQEDITVELVAAGTAIMLCGGGAYVDPDTSAALAAESDGRRYGLWTSGTTAPTTYLANATAGNIFTHNAAAGNVSHTYLKRQGTNTTDAARRMWFTATPTISEMTNAAGELVGIPIPIASTVAYGGRLREKTFVRGMLRNQIVSNAGATVGYALAPSTTTTGDCILLKY